MKRIHIAVIVWIGYRPLLGCVNHILGPWNCQAFPELRQRDDRMIGLLCPLRKEHSCTPMNCLSNPGAHSHFGSVYRGVVRCVRRKGVVLCDNQYLMAICTDRLQGEPGINANFRVPAVAGTGKYAFA